MNFGTNEVLIAVGAILTTWILNNSKLKEGTTDWFVSRLGIDTYNIQNHNVKESLKKLKFESKLMEFDNALKTELFHYYIETVLNAMNELVIDILTHEKKLSLEETKRLIKNVLYDKLLYIQNNVDNKIKMPGPLQDKFDRFRNYLALQHTYAVENALQSSNKKLLLVQVLDAIDNNSRWFLYYSSEMFEAFNGHFDILTKKDVFINRN